MNKTGLIAKISMKYVLPTCIWKYLWRISRDFAEKPEFRGSATARNIRSPVDFNGTLFYSLKGSQCLYHKAEQTLSTAFDTAKFIVLSILRWKT